MESVFNERTARWSTYIYAFFITSALFVTAFFLSTYFNNMRAEDIRATQEDISADILSIETQFDLLQERSCDTVAENTILPSALSALGTRLSFLESQQGTSDEVTRLKRLYSLLEIKDYLLMKQIASKCNLKPVFILFFYSNRPECADCASQGYVLTALSQKYPQLRIYSFDYYLDVAALQTLIDMDGVEARLPALVIDGKPYYGLQKVADIQKALPQLATLKTATSTSATSTER